MARDDKLIIQHIPLVRRIARRLAQTHAADVDDFVSAGLIGLIQAADRFDSTRSTSFPAYAERRIRGAILDSFRIDDTYGRRERDRRKDPEYVQSGRAAQVHGWRDDNPLEMARMVCTRSENIHSSRDVMIFTAVLMARLPARLRRVMQLYYFDDKTDEEIAHMYKRTPTRIWQMRREARVRLRKESARLNVTLADVL